MAGLQWIRLDCTFPENPKIMDLVDDNNHRVVVAHVSMMCHVGKTGSDGFFTQNAMKRYGISRKDSVLAVDSGLWIPARGNGFEINDWAEHNPVDDAAQARSEKARRAAEKRWQKRNGRDENGLDL